MATITGPQVEPIRAVLDAGRRRDAGLIGRNVWRRGCRQEGGCDGRHGGARRDRDARDRITGQGQIGGQNEGERSSKGISQAVKLTGDPAPQATKSASISSPFPPAAETWARTVVLSLRSGRCLP